MFILYFKIKHYSIKYLPEASNLSLEVTPSDKNIQK